MDKKLTEVNVRILSKTVLLINELSLFIFLVVIPMGVLKSNMLASSLEAFK